MYKYFNSIKVRLKQCKGILTSMIKQFQFHKGTIKTSSFSPTFNNAIVFQFHKGTIKTIC